MYCIERAYKTESKIEESEGGSDGDGAKAQSKIELSCKSDAINSKLHLINAVNSIFI